MQIVNGLDSAWPSDDFVGDVVQALLHAFCRWEQPDSVMRAVSPPPHASREPSKGNCLTQNPGPDSAYFVFFLDLRRFSMCQTPLHRGMSPLRPRSRKIRTSDRTGLSCLLILVTQGRCHLCSSCCWIGGLCCRHALLCPGAPRSRATNSGHVERAPAKASGATS